MSELKTDIAIIGAGPGGYTAAIRAAELGKKVVVIDKESVGGVCLHHGCIPTKALIRAAQAYQDAKASEHLGINATAKIDFKKTQEWKSSIVKKLDMGVRYLLKHHKVELVKATATFSDSNTLELEGNNEYDKLNFKKCIIAAGSRERELACAVVDGKNILNSTQAIEIQKIPKSVLVIGGGYIGIELSQMFSKLGTKVIIVEALPDIINQLDPEFTALIKKRLEAKNAEIYLNAKVCSVKPDGTTEIETAEGKKKLKTEKVLVSVGRVPNSDKLGIKNTKVKLDKHGFIEVDDTMKSSDSNIYAVGDINGGDMLAHKAAFEARIAAENIAGKKSRFNNYVPYAMFSDPEISGIGLTEKQAKADKVKYKAKLVKSGLLGKYQIMGANDSILKILYDSKGMILGIQMAGPHSSDLIGEFAVAIQNKITLKDLSNTIHPHPTLVEAASEMADLVLGYPINLI